MARTWLINLRELAKLAHEDVAKEARISRQYYGMIENSDRNPSVDVAKRIAKVMGFDWTLFFEQEGNKVLLDEKSAVGKEAI